MAKKSPSSYYGSVQHVADLAIVDIQCHIQWYEEVTTGEYVEYTDKRVMEKFHIEMTRLAQSN